MGKRLTSEEVIKLLISDEGMNYTTQCLRNAYHFQRINIPHLYTNLVSVLRSFTEDITIQPVFNIQEALANQSPVEVTSCECIDDVGFILASLDIMLQQGDGFVCVLLRGATERDYTPFERYTFTAMADGNYYLSALSQYDYKIKFGEPFSPAGTNVFWVYPEGNGMINDRNKAPRFTGIRGTSRQQTIPLTVYVDKRGRTDE